MDAEIGGLTINAAGKGGTYKSALAAVTLNENTENLKERPDAMMKLKNTPRRTPVVSVALTFVLLFCLSIMGANAKEQEAPPKYISPSLLEQNSAAQKTFESLDEYAAFYHLESTAVSSLSAEIQDVISQVTVWPGTVTRREVCQGIYVEFWTRTELKPTGRYVWSEIQLTNGKNDDRQILLRLKTPDFLITDGAVSLPEQSAGSVEGWAWSGSAASAQRSEGEITYIETKFTASLMIGGTTQTITPVCTMVSNAPKGNQYRVGLIHAVWNGTESEIPIPIPQAPDISVSQSAAPKPTGERANHPTFLSNPVYNPDVVYRPDANGVLTIPFSIEEIKKDAFLCLGQVPCITQNADSISIEAQSQNGNGICVWVNETDLSEEYKESCFLEWRDVETPGKITGSFHKLRDASYNDHTGNFYIYVGVKDGTDLTNVSGTVTVQTYKNLQ